MSSSTVCRTTRQPKGTSDIYENSNLPKSNSHSPWIQFPSNIVNLAAALKRTVISSSTSSASSSSSSIQNNLLSTNNNNNVQTSKGSRFKKSNILKIKSANPLRYPSSTNDNNILKKITSDSRKRSQSLTNNGVNKPKLEIPTSIKESSTNERKDSSCNNCGTVMQQTAGHLKASSKEGSSTTTPTTPTPTTTSTTTNGGRRNSTQGQILNPLARSRIKHCLRNAP